MSFIQAAPEFTNPFEKQLFQEILQITLKGKTEKDTITADLKQFSDQLLGEVHGWSLEADANPPQHIPYSPFGERIDTIKVHDSWKKLDELSAREGLIQLGYNPDNLESGRLHQFLKLFLFHPSSAFYSCPLAMTDGAAKLITTLLKTPLKESEKEILTNALTHLTSRDPEHFWTSGQWMTEKTGGSDVGYSETVAKKEGKDYRLYGTKWFTSATTSQMCFTLARTEDAPEGSRGLSLFFVKLHKEDGSLNQMQVRRLKDKLGTHALPTAEIDLQGTPATLIGNSGEGVKTISHLFNVTRIYNAVTSVANFFHILHLAIDYSEKRVAFKKRLCDLPLHKRMLDEAKEACRDCMLLTFYTVDLLQKEETLAARGERDEAVSTLLRLMTPLTKLYTAKINMQWTSELIESFGGAGYIEDTGLPRLLRDSQVLCIWEGTTNVLSLDCLRAIMKEDALSVFLNEVSSSRSSKAVEGLVNDINALTTKCGKESELWEYHARDLSFLLCQTMIEYLKSEA